MLPEGSVVPFFAQANAHSKCAAETLGRFFCRSMALQQFIFAMPLMLHWLSPKFIGTPATAPPKSTSKRNKDASRDFIASRNVRNNFTECQELGLRSLCENRPAQFDEPPENAMPVPTNFPRLWWPTCLPACEISPIRAKNRAIQSGG